MDISPTLLKQLQTQQIPYDTVHHRYSISSLNSAHTAHVPAEQLVKSVILHDQQGYIMALVPSDRYVYLKQLNNKLNRSLEISRESEVTRLFNDCASGAIPPMGEAYGMQMVVDSCLDQYDELYMESGNHTDLIHLSGESFQKLTTNSTHADITVH